VWHERLSQADMESTPRSGWVLYDAACGVCSRWVPAWAPRLERYGLAIAPLQSSWVPARTGLTGLDLLTDIRLLELDGTLHSGADVYRYLLRRSWWGYPLYLLSQIPGFRQLFDWAYRTFARHRMRISASCGLPGAR
jgi:predicted DCC family thiol-disulfide oxidoreductase YuxK